MFIIFVSRFGECKGSDTQILSDDQWSWFESELDKESEIKIIGSGVQVLPPTVKKDNNLSQEKPFIQLGVILAPSADDVFPLSESPEDRVIFFTISSEFNKPQ